MDKISSPGANDDIAEEIEPSTIRVKSLHQLKELLHDLNKLPTKPPSIYIDGKGIGQNVLTELHIWVPPTKTLYNIRLRYLGATAFSPIHAKLPSLCAILESDVVPKVAFDIRGLSRVLYYQFGVPLGGMCDLQLMELASGDYGVSKKFLAGLMKCIDKDIPSTNTAKVQWLNPGDTTSIPRRHIRPVELFPTLWAVYRRKLGAPGQAFWLASVRNESRKRVSESKGNPGRQGPAEWWNAKLRQAAMDEWLENGPDDVFLGDMELNDDAE
jgi:exonuclease 3'-5' domain-containing protein 1